MVDKEAEGQESEDTEQLGDPTGPLLSFDSDTAAMPHWADAPTGEIPVIPGADDTGDESDSPGEPSGGSRLFPQLPDDPDMVDTSGTTRFDAVRSDTLPTLSTQPLGGTDDGAFAPPGGAELDPLATGPMDLGGLDADPTATPAMGGDPAPPVADTTVIRGLGERDPGAMFDRDPASDARDEELRAATALGGGQIPDFDAPVSDISGSASLHGDSEDSSGQDSEVMPVDNHSADDPWARLDALPGLDDGPVADPTVTPASALDGSEPLGGSGDVSADPTPAGGAEFPSPPDVTALFDDDAPTVTAPLGSAEAGAGGATQDPGPEGEGDRLDSWADLDAPAPHWREGNQDYEERTAVSDDERTVLHFGDEGGPVGDEPGEPRSGRNLPMAILSGAALAAMFFGLLRVGPGAAMVMVVIALVLAGAEFFQAVRNVGYRPAALLGLASIAGLALAAYWRGFEAYPLVIGLTVLGGLLWFLFGVEGEHATANLAITLMGVGWIGVLGSFAAMILKLPNGDAVLIGAVIGTVAYDVGGYVIGSTTGQSRLAPHISPNKTYEGLIGGMILAIVVTTLALNSLPGVFPWTENMTDALWLGIAIAVMAPLGDLTQSLVKRDLGVKDMGTLLPGHGGVFDRFDALLFVLPAAYYVADLVLY
ncbi:MAG: phosphatidate cytidylyltransferase [Actinomycetota bacterium]|nr:phosphatidate cytidylyltransferase [Actinomycetota bacterium]